MWVVHIAVLQNFENTLEAAVREDLVSSSLVTEREALESLRQSRPNLLQNFFRTLSFVTTIAQLSESGLKIHSKGFAANLAEFRCQGSPNSFSLDWYYANFGEALERNISICKEIVEIVRYQPAS